MSTSGQANAKRKTRLIPLTQGKVAIVDAADYARLAKVRWFAVARKRSNGTVTWYAQRTTFQRDGPRVTVMMHRQIKCRPDDHRDVDHKDGDGLNNRRGNLRLLTRRKNVTIRHNLRGTKTSRFLGVFKSGKAWRADIYAGPKDDNGHKKRIGLGSFANEEDAAKAFDMAALRYRGRTATTNKKLGLLE